MSNSCDVTKDLLPLYLDCVCSDASKKLVETHLQDCEPCRSTLEKMRNRTYDERLQSERETVITHQQQRFKKKTAIAGLSIAAVMAVPVLVCLIVNLATGHALNWFFIVLTSLMVAASLSVIPLLAEDRKFLWTVGSFTLSLLALLLTCNVYSGGNWFFVASTACLFGLCVAFLPFAVYQLRFGGFLSRNKGLLVMTADTALLYALILVCGLHGSFTNWTMALSVTTVNVLFPWILFLVIRYLKGNGFIRSGLCVILSSVFIAFLSDILSGIIDGVSVITILQANLRVWDYPISDANIKLLILLCGTVLGIVLLSIGLIRSHRQETTTAGL